MRTDAGERLLKANAVRGLMSAGAHNAGEGQNPSELFTSFTATATAAVVRVVSVGEGGVRVSWLARTGHVAFFFSPPVFESPGNGAVFTRSAHD
jgi:hypothetical protein